MPGTLAPMLPVGPQPVAPRKGRGLAAAVVVVLLVCGAAGYWLAVAPHGSTSQGAAPVQPDAAAPAAANTPIAPQATKPPRADVPAVDDDDDPEPADDDPFPRRRTRRNRTPTTPPPSTTDPPPTTTDPPPPPPPQRCDVRAGLVWSDAHARQVCQLLCARAGATRFTGQWHTITQGVMSVCECEYPAGTACPR
jgi:hypothetical protein